MTFGLNLKNKDQYGIMMYHRNRLIKAYEKVGCQLKVKEKVFTVASGMLPSMVRFNGNLPLLKSHAPILCRPQVKEQGSGSLVSSSVTSSNLLTTSKTLNTPKNTGTAR